ncbi:MAG: hypothetical protein PWP48_1877, partial [Clostridiales bacterium]|nr:hypothetical protein [Clostridiales bacterium]MDK2992644.1 hypothetical protein [Clostridiales bacterium]
MQLRKRLLNILLHAGLRNVELTSLSVRNAAMN